MNHYDQQKLQEIEQKIGTLIDQVNEGVKWTNQFLAGDIGKQTAIPLKNIRRDLKKIQAVVTENPSSALYGESQVGKSYLVKNLLSNSGGEFRIKDRSSNKDYDFLKEINPQGGGVEATSVVTRFSTQVKIPRSDFPIKIKLLTPKDIILLLCDTYYKDVMDHHKKPNQERILQHLNILRGEFSQKQAIQGFFTEDDIFDIKAYCNEHLRGETSELGNSPFWEQVSEFIANVPVHRWQSVFGILWADNPFINKIFTLLIDALEKVQFSSVVYAEFESVLRKHGTLIHVARLKELGSEPKFEDVNKADFKRDTRIIFEQSGKFIQNTISKSELCALTAELVIEIDQELEYDKIFLKTSDLLDFPGARSRMQITETKLVDSYIGQLVLRGKVSYIFNKYSSQYKISNLLFCNKDEKIEVTYIPKLLNSWIENYIGENPEQREEFLRSTPIPPLFIIYTFFNNDLAYNKNVDVSTDVLQNKWTKRFFTIFQKEILTQSYEWHHKWTIAQPNFQNNYLLRDFEYSSSVFTGYSEKGTETGEVKVGIPNYLEELKESFISFGFVKNHFKSPEATWQGSATLNRDGSQLIIDNLTSVSNNVARTDKFIRHINRMALEVHGLLDRHYHSDDADKKIREAARKAGEINLNIDTVFGKDPYAFGRFMKAFIIRESACYNFYKEALDSLDLIESANLNFYILIRNRNPDLSPNKPYEENAAILMKTYEKDTIEELEDHLKNQGVDLNELFYGQANKLKNNSLLLAEQLRDFWLDNYLKKERFQEILAQGFSEMALAHLFENIRLNFQSRSIATEIAQNIREYVDRYDRIEEAQEMIADISASIINRFITSMGWDFMKSEEIKDLEKTNQYHQLNLNLNPYEDIFFESTNDQIAQLFDHISKYEDITQALVIDPTITKNFPNLNNISKWTDQMQASFISTCDRPTYDPLANQSLGTLLDTVQSFTVA